MKQIALVEPTTDLKFAYLEMVADYQAAGESYIHHETAQRHFEIFLGELWDMAMGINLLPGFVPMDSFWMVKDDQIVLGESRLRHRLTPALEVEGGHIGYAIRPSVRRQGYGTLILELTLEKARSRGLRRVLVTCDTDNLGSARIIEKNGGVLSGSALSPRSGVPISQYWIEL